MWNLHLVILFICFSWQPGITTDEIDQAVHNIIIDNGAYPSPLGYGGFPKSVCTSVNECICHGIPDSRELEVCLINSRSQHLLCLDMLSKDPYTVRFAGW